MTSGDVICLSTPLVGRDGQFGRWTSSDPSLVVVDQRSGIGHVTGSRSGQIALEHSLHPGAGMQMRIVASDEIVIYPPKNAVLTNAPGVPIFRVPLVIRNSGDVGKTTNFVSVLLYLWWEILIA